MAISKRQPMRQAEIDLVDEVNRLTATLTDTNTVLGDLSQELGQEIELRNNQYTSLDARITALEQNSEV